MTNELNEKFKVQNAKLRSLPVNVWGVGWQAGKIKNVLFCDRLRLTKNLIINPTILHFYLSFFIFRFKL